MCIFADTIYTPQGDGNRYLEEAKPVYFDTIYTPQGDGNKKIVISTRSLLDTIYTPQGDEPPIFLQQMLQEKFFKKTKNTY